MPETEPRYTVELTTEGWQIKDNKTGRIGADFYGLEHLAKERVRWLNKYEQHDKF